MINITLRFYGDLNDLLFTGFTGPVVERQLSAPTTAKDLIEGCGIPHTEVDVILANGRPVNFSWLAERPERISVYPFFNTLDIPTADRLQERSLSALRFLADVNLGKLARYLRIAGFDTTYRNDATDRELLAQMTDEQRVLLTRDRKLLMHKIVKHGYLPRSDAASEQLEEVLERFNLFGKVKPYSRCPHCNSILQSVPKEKVLDQLEPLTKRYFDNFSQCPGCKQVYWAGSHRERLDSRVKEILGQT